jgi:hypothetical protein
MNVKITYNNFWKFFLKNKNKALIKNNIFMRFLSEKKKNFIYF